MTGEGVLMNPIMQAIHRSTLEARKRTGDEGISVQVGSGQAQVVHVYYAPSGHYYLTPMSSKMPVGQVATYLDSYTV